ncbi:Peptidoglycan-N-acetylglucosamine deacetylase [Sporomusa rhizae]|uniref:polysaccharide deacetylase family protein n=1 Tax=Sporomusa rhizae TaxID=357999 RepID=UPI00352AC97C
MRRLVSRNFFSIIVLTVGVLCSLMYETMIVLEDKDSVIKRVPTTHKVVALTIDDGPHYKTSPELLKVLREKQAKVTFFVLGVNVKEHPEIVAQEVADGHEIACHAYSHQLLNSMPLAAVTAEVDRAQAAIVAAGAPAPTLFRPPGGVYNDKIVAMLRERGYRTVLWSVDTGDWRRPSVEHVIKTTMDNVKPGSIVLMHDGQYPLPTPQAIGIIIDKLRDQGYQLVTVSELLQYYEEIN